MKKVYKRSSEILQEIAQAKHLEGDLTYRSLVNTLGERAFGIIIVFFSLPSLLPLSVIPGVAFSFSLPIAFLAIQMIGKRKSLWLPLSIARKTIPHQKVSSIITAALPYIVRLERFTKPRWVWMTSPGMDIMNGIALLLLSILLMLPIPLSNFIFASSIAFFGLGMIENDGVFIFLGYICLSVYILFVYLLALTALNLF